MQSQLSDDTMEFILSQISDGVSVKAACDEVGVARTTFRRRAQTEQWAAKYAQARDDQLDAWADEIDAATTALPWVNEAIAAQKLRVDTLKWMMSKLRPGTYGDKVRNEHTGANGGPIQQRTEVVVTDEQTDGALDALRQVTGSSRPGRAEKARH